MLKKCMIETCGKEFESMSNNAKYCPECRKKIKNKYNKPYLRKPQKKDSTKTKPLSEIVAELEEYNRQHNTRLTYGKYVLMLNFLN